MRALYRLLIRLGQKLNYKYINENACQRTSHILLAFCNLLTISLVKERKSLQCIYTLFFFYIVHFLYGFPSLGIFFQCVSPFSFLYSCFFICIYSSYMSLLHICLFYMYFFYMYVFSTYVSLLLYIFFI